MDGSWDVRFGSAEVLTGPDGQPREFVTGKCSRCGTLVLVEAEPGRHRVGQGPAGPCGCDPQGCRQGLTARRDGARQREAARAAELAQARAEAALLRVRVRRLRAEVTRLRAEVAALRAAPWPRTPAPRGG